MSAPFEALFLPAGSGRSGQRFCLFHAPHGAVRGAVVHVHAFAEEMNKSRRMAALQARALARSGYAVLQIDLLGCGDSSGDLNDATWSDWLDDVRDAARWLQARCPAPLWLWGHRAGALIAAEAAARIDAPCHFLFWQPATAGKLLLQQFLRLKVAGDMHDGRAKGVMASLREHLAAGRSVEVAGYTLPAALAAGLDRSALDPPARGGMVRWFELSQQPDAELSPSSQTAIGRWREAGFDVRPQLVVGPSFWQSAEIEDAPALIDATVAALTQYEAVPA